MCPLTRRSAMLLFVPLLLVGCGDEEPTEPPKAVSGDITPADTTIFRRDSLMLEAVVLYESGPKDPDTVAWSVSDGSVLAITHEAADSCTVAGLARGEAYVIGLIDKKFVDSTAVTVVQPGDVRWSVEVGSPSGYPNPLALDDQGRIYVVGGYPDTRLSAFESDGTPVYSVPSRYGSLSPSVLPDGWAYVAGNSTQRYNPDGTLDWDVPISISLEGGIAVGSDGSVAVLHWEDLAWVLSLISPEGIEEWRTTLGSARSGNMWSDTAPVIAWNGDIYAVWRDAADIHHASRVSADGTLRWTRAFSPGCTLCPNQASPALWEDRVVFPVGGVVVFDTTGVILWERKFGVGGMVSSPAIDAVGNIYLQATDGLRSYDPEGALRWVDESYGCSHYGVGAPTLLSDGQLIVPCGSTSCDRVCSANSSDGSPHGQGISVATVGSPAVARDGTIYVHSKQGELVALWDRVPPLTEGWPTEGGGMGRLRRQQ